MIDPEFLEYATQRQREVLGAAITHGGNRAAERELGLASGTVSKAKKAVEKKARAAGYIPPESIEADTDGEPVEKNKRTENDDAITLNYVGKRIKTVDELLDEHEIDRAVWEIDRVTINRWEVAGKISTGDGAQKLWQLPNLQIRVTLKRKSDERRTIERLLADLANARPVISPKRTKVAKPGRRRLMLEICVMDPHIGMRCKTPEGDQTWNLELARDFYLFAVDDLIREAQRVGDVESISWVVGNDFNHVDNVQNETTAGTAQPESVGVHESFLTGEQIAIAAADQMLKTAPVNAYQIPGNHDYFTSYTMGRVLNAWFRNHSDFEIDATMNPFKKIRYGASLIGLEHGSAISPIRFAALMANEWPQEWADTHYHEWHLGDQHRRGSSKPCTFEEQGVSVDYLPGLVAPNEWHRKKSFNFQKRAATGFVWDYDTGLAHRINCNISKYTGRFLGRGFDQWLAARKGQK